MGFILLVARSMGVGHAIERQELALVVENRDLWFEIVQKNKKFVFGKPKEKNKEDRQKPRAQGRVFSMTHRDAQATSDMVTGTLRIHTLFARALIDPSSMHSFVSVSFSGLLVCRLITWTLIYLLLLLWEILLCLIK